MSTISSNRYGRVYRQLDFTSPVRVPHPVNDPPWGPGAEGSARLEVWCYCEGREQVLRSKHFRRSRTNK